MAKFDALVLCLVSELILRLLNNLSIIIGFGGQFTMDVTFSALNIASTNLTNADDIILNALLTHVTICYDVSCLLILFGLEQAASTIVRFSAPCRADKAHVHVVLRLIFRPQ